MAAPWLPRPESVQLLVGKREKANEKASGETGNTENKTLTVRDEAWGLGPGTETHSTFIHKTHFHPHPRAQPAEHTNFKKPQG